MLPVLPPCRTLLVRLVDSRDLLVVPRGHDLDEDALVRAGPLQESGVGWRGGTWDVGHHGIAPLVPPKDELLQPRCHSVPKACSIQPTSPLPRFCHGWCKTTRSGQAGAARFAPAVTSTAFRSCLASYCAGVSMSPRISLAKLPDSSDFRSAIRSCKGIRVFHSPDPSAGTERGDSRERGGFWEDLGAA